MTREENNLLIALLQKKQAECSEAIEIINEMFDSPEEAKHETIRLRELQSRIMFTRLGLESGSLAQRTLDHMTDDGMINRTPCEPVKTPEQKTLDKIREWADSSHAHLCNRDGYPRGYRNGISTAKEIILGLLQQAQ